MLVNCAAYQHGRKLAEITREEISDYLERPDTFVWVGLKDATEAELLEMQEEFDLHPLAVEDARKGHQRPKLEQYGESLFLVLHTFHVEGSEIEDGEVALFAGPNYVLSVRQRTPRGFNAVRERCEREPELLQHGPAFVLYALIDDMVDRYFPVIDTLESELEDIEDRLLVRRASRATIESLYHLKRKLLRVRHAVTPLLEELAELQSQRIVRIAPELRDYYRDVFDHLGRIEQAIDSTHDMLATGLQVNLGLISLTQSEVSKRLAAWAAIIAVPTLIAGLYGMNFDHMPELRWTFGYPFAIALMAAIDGYLYYRFRKAGWI
jgi:magnesium transporter